MRGQEDEQGLEEERAQACSVVVSKLGEVKMGVRGHAVGLYGSSY
jgi:hypothetical protein